MQFTATQLDAMLQPPMGQTANIDDGSLDGLDIYCKFTSPRRVINEFSGSVEMSEPQAKVRFGAVEQILARGVRFTTGGRDYVVRTFEPLDSGFCLLILGDA